MMSSGGAAFDFDVDAAPPELALFFACYYKHLAPPEPGASCARACSGLST